MPCRSSRHDSSGGASQSETRPTRRRVDSEAAGREPLSGHLAADKRAARSAGSSPASSSVGAHAHPHPERTAGHCLGEWITTRSCFVEQRRASEDRVFTVAAAYRVSTDRVAGHVQKDGRGNQELDPASRRTSWPTIPSATAYDPSRNMSVASVVTGPTPGRSGAVRGWQGPGQLCRAHPWGTLQRKTTAARQSDQTR